MRTGGTATPRGRHLHDGREVHGLTQGGRHGAAVRGVRTRWITQTWGVTRGSPRIRPGIDRPAVSHRQRDALTFRRPATTARAWLPGFTMPVPGSRCVTRFICHRRPRLHGPRRCLHVLVGVLHWSGWRLTVKMAEGPPRNF